MAGWWGFSVPTPITRLLILCLLTSTFASAAVLTVQNQVAGPTPQVMAYNLGHFQPGSNTADWWRYSRVSGGRIFLAPSHFNVTGSARPGEDAVVDQATFLARREAVRADPLNLDHINWPLIETRFNTNLQGNNRIRPRYALEEIHRRGGVILAQMSLGAFGFPIADEDDWAGKWVAWRTYYSVAFYLAREFDVERFASHNEPNHPNTFIDTAPWLMRKRLAADAVQSALADVNALYGKWLRPRFHAPVTAGTTGVAFDDYGQPALAGIDVDFLGDRRPGYQSFQLYSYQAYNSNLDNLTAGYHAVRAGIAAHLPSGVAPLPLAVSEFNVHTGADYDTRPESSDTLSKALRFGAQAVRYTALGVDELYAFKFGMTQTSVGSVFPVQKNGMLFSDNLHPPYNHGAMSRSAEVYRLFLKGFAPGRQLLAHQLSGAGAGGLQVLVSHDPAGRFYHVFSVNESGGSVPLEIDLSALAPPEGNVAVIEDVSAFRTGVVRSLETVTNGRLLPGNQPDGTVWLITLPADPQRVDDGSRLFSVPARLTGMVRDGAHAHANFAQAPLVYARNDPESADERAAVFLRFDLPPDWHPDDLLLGLLSVRVGPLVSNPEGAHAHLYGLDQPPPDAAQLTWHGAPNLRQGAAAGNLIRDGVVTGAGETAHILGQLAATSPVVRRVDVTDYLVRQSDGTASFLIAQDPRWNVDIRVTTLPESWDDLPTGDTQASGLRVFDAAAVATPEDAPRLILIRRPKPVQTFDAWVRQFDLNDGLLAESFDYPDGPLAGRGGWARGPNSDATAEHLVVADGAVRFDWTTAIALNNVVRRLWPEELTVTDDWVFATFDLHVLEPPETASAARPGFLSFGDGSGNQQRGLVGIRAGTPPGTYQLGISSRLQTGEHFRYAPLHLPVGVPETVTLGFHAGTEETALWIHSVRAVGPPVLRVGGEGVNNGLRRVNLRLHNTDGGGGTTRLGVFTVGQLDVTTVNPALVGPEADPVGDGLPNLLKFALGLDPGLPVGAAGNRAPWIVAEPPAAGFYFTRNDLAGGVRLTVETSPDLHEWQTREAPTEQVGFGRVQTHRVPLEETVEGGRLFLRVRATTALE